MTTLFTILLIATIVANGWFLWLLIQASKKIDHPSETEITPQSVIIPFRNESEHLEDLLQHLAKQDFPADQCELIFVDDHSTDNGAELIAQFTPNLPFPVKVIHLKPGQRFKKAALKAGIEVAKNDRIVTTDADTTMGRTWLKDKAGLASKDLSAMILGPVIISRRAGLIPWLQHVESLFLTALSRASALLNRPVLSSGANLAFSRGAFNALGGYESHAHLPSGDDQFLMHAHKKSSDHSIRYIDSCVFTNPVHGMRSWAQQRIRWAGKSRHITDLDTSRLVGVMLVSMIWALLIPWVWLWSIHLFLTALLFFFGISWMYWRHCRKLAKSHDQKLTYAEFLTFFWLLPYYVCFITILAFWFPVKWKGRKINNIEQSDQ